MDVSGQFMGIDIGTSGVRAVLYDKNLTPISEAAKPLSVLTPRPGWVEQNPAIVLDAVTSVIKATADKAGPALSPSLTMGFSCMMHSLLVCDKQLKPSDHAWLWSDLRSTVTAKELKARYGLELYHRTGCPTHPAFWPSKLGWLRQNQPTLWQSARYFLSLKDYLIYNLTGVLATDYSTASSTGLLCSHTRTWDTSLLTELGIAPLRLPPLGEPTDLVGKLHADLARALGLSSDTYVAMGGTDGTLSNVGVGAVTNGNLALMIGSSAACRGVSQVPKTHPQGSTWCYYLAQDTWLVGGATNNGGNMLEWFQRLCPRHMPSFEELTDLAAASPPGARGLLFLTFLAGERSPAWNPSARGTILGLTLSHELEDILRALLEGVCLQATSMSQTVIEVLGMPHTIRATGGFTKSPFWLQLMADVSGLPLQVTSTSQGSAFGAAVMAMVSQGVIRHFSDVEVGIELDSPILPDPSNQVFYQRLQELYHSAYLGEEANFELMANWQDTSLQFPPR